MDRTFSIRFRWPRSPALSTVPPGGYILITFNVFGGRAFVYSSVIDNRTSDSTFRLADIK